MERGERARTRLVGSFWMAGEPIDFRALCERAVPLDTRLLVLDLDRTLHLGRNMGELLGCEIGAYQGYGPAYLTELEPTRPTGYMFFAPRRPLGAVRYLWSAVRVWALPGLFYLLWCKLAARFEVLRRQSYRRFGPEPVRAVQKVPQQTLFRQMSALPEPTVRELAARVWARYRPDLIVEPEDLAWLRARCPGIRIVLSSASPRLVVETAARALGIDEVIGSTPERINAGRLKLEELRARFPELLGRDGITTVGISDTGYGEDHCWVEAFTHVVDVNSTSGFPPIVPADAPLRAVFSAPVLTRAEKDALARGERTFDRRRRPAAGAGAALELGAAELEKLLAPVRAVVERSARELEARLQGLEAGARAALGGRAVAEAAFALASALEQARALVEGRFAPAVAPVPVDSGR